MPFRTKEWLDCCMDVCSSYRVRSDIGLERLFYQSKIISINIRISPLLSREKVKHARVSEIAIIILSLKFIGSFEAAAFSLLLNLFFPPSRFSLLSSGRSLCYLPHFWQQNFGTRYQRVLETPKIFLLLNLF